MASLSNFVNSLSKGIHKIKWRQRHYDKCEICEIKDNHYEFFLEYSNFKYGLIEYKYVNKSLMKTYRSNIIKMLLL